MITLLILLQTADETRDAIAERVEAFRAKPATLGLLRETVNLAIDYGDTAYEEGDVEACRDFYRETARALCEAFEAKERASADARAGLGLLRRGLTQAESLDEEAAQAWALHYAFDRLKVDWDSRSLRAMSLLQLGNEYFGRSQFAPAVEAYADAAGLLEELTGTDPDELDLGARLGPMMQAHALLALERWEEAAGALGAAVRFMPTLPELGINVRALHPDPDDFDLVFERLQKAAGARADSAALQFLLGYVHFSIEQPEEAKRCLRRALELSPEHAAAKAFLSRAEEMEPDF